MAWIKSQDNLQTFKRTYTSGDFIQCIKLLDGFQNNEIPYLSKALAKKVIGYLTKTNSYDQLYGLCKAAGEKSRKIFAENALTEYRAEIWKLFKKKGSKPVTYLTEAAHNVFIPITNDFLAGDLHELARLLDILKNHEDKGVKTDEEFDRYCDYLEENRGSPAVVVGLLDDSNSRARNEMFGLQSEIEKGLELEEFLKS